MRKSLISLLILSTSLSALTERELELRERELQIEKERLELEKRKADESSQKQVNIIIQNSNQSENDIKSQGGSNNNSNSSQSDSSSGSYSEAESEADVDVEVEAPVYREKRRKRPQGLYISANGIFGKGVFKSKRDGDFEEEIYDDIAEKLKGYSVKLGFGEFEDSRFEISFVNRDVEWEDNEDTPRDESEHDRNAMQSLALDLVLTGYQSGIVLPYVKIGGEYGRYKFTDSDYTFFERRKNIVIEDETTDFYGARAGLGIFIQFGNHLEMTLGAEAAYIAWQEVEVEEDRIIDNNILYSADVGLTFRF